METNLAAVAQSSQTPKECTPPPVCHDFQTSRLFLSHFGLLALDSDGTEVELLENKAVIVSTFSYFRIQN